MNPNDTHLDRDLRDFPVPEPPQGLLEKLKADIPDTATLAGKGNGEAKAARRWPLRAPRSSRPETSPSAWARRSR